MEHMDRLDEFMQRKFAKDDPEQRLAFREDYWLQAQALIDAAARRQKRRRLFWWWAGGGLGMIVIALGWWTMATPSPSAVQTPMAQTQPAVPETAVPDAPIPAGKQTAPAGREAVSTPSTTATGAPIAPVSRTQSEVVTAASASSHPALTTTPPTPQYQSEVATVAPRAVRPGARGGEVAVKWPPLTEKPSTAVPEQAAKSAQPLLPPLTPLAGAATAQPPSTIQTDVATPAGDEPADATSVSDESPTTRFVTPDLLPLPLTTLPLQLHPEVSGSNFQLPASNPPVVAPTERYHDWRYQVGVTAGVSTRSGYLSAEKPGTTFGLTNSLHRNGALVSLHADLLWRRRPGGHSDAGLNSRSEQLRYSFGYVLDLTEDRVTAVHWLEFPMYVQFHWRQFRASAGIAPALLLAVYGRKEHTRQTSLQPDPVRINSEKVRVSDHFFKPGGVSLLTGIEWQATKRFNFGLRLHFQPGAIQRDPYDIAGPYTPPAHRAFWGEARVVCTLFNAK